VIIPPASKMTPIERELFRMAWDAGFTAASDYARECMARPGLMEGHGITTEPVRRPTNPYAGGAS
jgi:hypothetical protein